SHRGRCSYSQIGVLPHQNRGSSRTVGAPAPGAKVLWLDTLFAPRAVLLQPNRGSPTSKPGFSSNRRSTRPGCEGALARHPFRTEAVLRQPAVTNSFDSPTTSATCCHLRPLRTLLAMIRRVTSSRLETMVCSSFR